MPQNKNSFPIELLRWFTIHGRDLPWRKDVSPYRIWISEIMLQQTRVETVIDYYQRFLEKFPAIFDLANADEQEVLTLWAGLGYYSRARNLHRCAKQVVDLFKGEFPTTKKELLSLPGIGEYTAGAILSIAFNLSYPAVDGNVIRVYSRLYAITENTVNTNVIKNIQDLVQQTLPEGNASFFNQALMDLGAGICIPKYPRCEVCPIQAYCKAYDEGIAAELPIKSKKKPQKKLNVIFGIIQDGNEILIEKNDSEDLYRGLFILPTIEVEEECTASIHFIQNIKQRYDLDIEFVDTLMESKHVFTHQIWDIQVYLFSLKKNVETVKETPLLHWTTKESLKKYPFPTSYKRVLERYFKTLKK